MQRISTTTFLLKNLVLYCVLVLLMLAGPAAGQADLLQRLKEYPASMRCKDVQVSTLLRAMGRQTGINIFVADTINATISFDMENLTLHDVFLMLAETQKLHYFEKNNILFIQKKEDFQEEQKNLISVRICANFGMASQHLNQIQPLKSEIGTVTVIDRENCLLIRDRQENITLMREMLTLLDRPIPQVHIEARIVAVSDEGKRQLGVKWGYMNAGSETLLELKNKPVTIDSDLLIPGAGTSLTLGYIWDNMNLNVELQALQDDSQLDILSAPSVLVLDGREAKIKQGKEVPYTSQSGDNLSTSFREATLSLNVTPKILPNGLIMLDVTITNDSVDQTNQVGGEPLINRQEITTNLYMENNVTVVIGGIKSNYNELATSGIPVLKDIPLIGGLFKSRDKRNDSYELLIFLTPTIVSMERARVYSAQTERYFQLKGQETDLHSFSSSYERPLDAPSKKP